ncbi:MAG TPA: CAP domain-containing protein [Candidatus Chromulinivoraceae bacterium]|nr:CAP domain-containing protein [Candidatus Chromulinivoraceae bacterium]
MKTKKKNTQVTRLQKWLRHHLKMALVPHGANQYRPHLIRRHSLLLVAVLVFIMQVSLSFSANGTVLGAQQPITPNDLLSETNQQRSSNNLQSLKLSDALSRAAFMKAQDMFKQQYWAHTAPDGKTPWYWFNEVGYNYAYAGENLAKDFSTAGAVTTAWMASPDHRANILDAHYTEMGIATVDGSLEGRPTTLVVVLYGEPVATLAAASAQPSLKASTSGSISIMTRVAMMAESLTPAAVMVLIVLTIMAGVALLTQASRNKLPKMFRTTWYRHHGAYKFVSIISLAVVFISLYSGGQI